MTREEFDSILWIERDIERKRKQIADIRSKVDSIVIDYKERVQTSNQNSSMKLIDELVDLEGLLKGDLALLYHRRKEAYIMIRELKGKERMVMEMKYIEGKSLEEIAVETGCSYKQAWRKRKSALKKLFPQEKNKNNLEKN